MTKESMVIYELVPLELHHELIAFYQDLQRIASGKVNNCPHCGQRDLSQTLPNSPHIYRCNACHKYATSATHTPFCRLSSLVWLETIFSLHLKKQSYQMIAYQLACSRRQVIRRYQAMLTYLKQHYVALYTWCTTEQQVDIPQAIDKQRQITSNKVNELLTIEHPICLYCGSPHTVKRGQRTCFRCKTCRRSFNLLHKTPLNRMPHADLWLTFIDLITARYTNWQISQIVQLNKSTVSKWRRCFCAMMKRWDCEALAYFCGRHLLLG